MRAVIVCVGMAEHLVASLPWNRHHFKEVMVVTAHNDKDTLQVAASCGARCLTTDTFWRGGAKFNKFAAVEEGLDALGRRGWLALLDCDVLWPRRLNLGKREDSFRHGYEFGCIHSMDGRRLWTGPPLDHPDEEQWTGLPAHDRNGPDGAAPHSECLGFTQIFHADDPALGEPPWHRLDLPSAARGDGLFQSKWDLSKKRWLPNAVLHLGTPTTRTDWEGVLVAKSKPTKRERELLFPAEALARGKAPSLTLRAGNGLVR